MHDESVCASTPSVGSMRRPSPIQTILWPFLSAMLLITASCGDFQDPSSGSPGTTLSYPSGLHAPQQQIARGEDQLTSGPHGSAVDPASLPAPTDMASAATEPFGAGVRGDTRASESTIEQFAPPPHTGTTQLSTGRADNMSPSLSRDEPQPQLVTWENRPRSKSVTLAWDPSLSGNADGYRVYLTAMSTLVQYAVDAGPAIQLTADLPLGERYYFTVVAYNFTGESPPATGIHFELF